jgi:hypothetical protein
VIRNWTTGRTRIANDGKNTLATRKGRFANSAGERSGVRVPVPGTASVRNARDDQSAKIAERRSIAMTALRAEVQSVHGASQPMLYRRLASSYIQDSVG